MEILEQVKEQVNTVVNSLNENLAEVQTKAEAQYGKLLEKYDLTTEKLKGEYVHQSTAFKGYQERLTEKFKNVNTATLLEDVKEEVAFFTTEFKNNIERLKASMN